MSLLDKLSGGVSAIKSVIGSEISVTVLGKGTDACKKLLENVNGAVKKLNAPIKVEYVSDADKVAKFGDVSLPALAVGDKVVLQGKVPDISELEELLKKFTK